MFKRFKILFLLIVIICAFPAFSAEVLNLSFDDVTDATVYDSSGYGNNGTLVGAVIVPDGKQGNAVFFDGVDDFLDLGESDFTIGETNAFTISFWVNISALPVDGTSIFIRRGLYIYPFSLHVITSGFVTFGIRTMEGTSYISGNTRVVENDWYHIAASFEDGNMSLYINGELESSRELYGTLNVDDPWSVEEGQVGQMPRLEDAHLNGLMDELKIYNTALADFEIYDIYVSESIQPTPEPTPEPTEPPVIDAPDLVIRDIVGNGNGHSSGNRVHFKVVVENIGDVRVFDRNVKFELTIDGEYFGWGKLSRPLAPGDTVDLQVRQRSNRPGLKWKATLGEHELSATIDSDNVILEKDETNNTFSKIITVGDNKCAGFMERIPGKKVKMWLETSEHVTEAWAHYMKNDSEEKIVPMSFIKGRWEMVIDDNEVSDDLLYTISYKVNGNQDLKTNWKELKSK